MNNLEVGAPLPQSIGLCADEYHRVRELRLAMEKEAKAVKAREDEIETYIIDNLSKSSDTGAAGLLYRAQIKVKSVPKLADWSQTTAWIAAHQRFDLLHKRLNNTAIVDMWENGESVPGVERVNVVEVSITKI